MLSQNPRLVTGGKHPVYTSAAIYETFKAMHNTSILKEWHYRGEGNANVVISLSNTRQILRIRKTEKTKTYFENCMETVMQYFKRNSPPSEGIAGKNIRNKFKVILENILEWCFYLFDIEYKKEIYVDMIGLEFYKQVMMPLLGKKFTSEATLIHLSKLEVAFIDDEIKKSRPEYRKNKRMLYGRATLFADYALLPKQLEATLKTTGVTYAVEIKPKQGWIPLLNRGTEKCQFCTNQFLKLEKGQINQISDYCPLDIFSGKERILKAIRNLIRCPQNNFRIFSNGTYTYGDKMKPEIFSSVLNQMFDSQDSCERLQEEFCELLHAILTKQVENEGCDYNCALVPYSSNVSAVFSPASSSLPSGCVLEKILSVQKLDQLGLKHYEACYKRVANSSPSDWRYVDELLDEMQASKCPKCVILKYVSRSNELFESARKSDSKTVDELDLLPYLVASIARDCSLMVTLKKLENSQECASNRFVARTSYGNFLVNIGVFDLYPKPLSTIPKHVKRDMRMEQVYSLRKISH